LEASRDAVDLPVEFLTTTTYTERHPLTWRKHYLVDHGAERSAEEALCFLAHSARSRTLWKWWNREPTIYSPPDRWTLDELLPGAWVDDDLPSAAKPNKDWIWMFRACGFLSDGPPHPDGPVRVYRAARPEGANCLSWTGSLDVATWYQQNAHRHLHCVDANGGSVRSVASLEAAAARWRSETASSGAAFTFTEAETGTATLVRCDRCRASRRALPAGVRG
jgi:hypothetical protein